MDREFRARPRPAHHFQPGQRPLGTVLVDDLDGESQVDEHPIAGRYGVLEHADVDLPDLADHVDERDLVGVPVDHLDHPSRDPRHMVHRPPAGAGSSDCSDSSPSTASIVGSTAAATGRGQPDPVLEFGRLAADHQGGWQRAAQRGHRGQDRVRGHAVRIPQSCRAWLRSRARRMCTAPGLPRAGIRSTRINRSQGSSRS